MKHTYRFALACVTISLLLLSGCSKKEESASTKPEAASAKDSVPMVPEQYRSPNFAPVAERLDLGGSVYAFMDFGTRMKDLGGNISKMLQAAQQMGNEPSLMMASMMPIDQIVDALGISNLAAYGSSSYLEDDLYHNKSVVYMPEGVKGLFTLAGKQAREFNGLKMAPENADVFLEAGFKASAAEAMIYEVAQKIYGDQAQQMMDSMLSARPNPNAPTWAEILDKSDANLIAVARIGQPIMVQSEDLGDLAIPSVEFVIALENMAWLINDQVLPTDMMTPTKQGDMTVYRDNVSDLQDEEYTSDWDPAFVTRGENLYLVNKIAFLEECFAANSSLQNSAQFQQATKGFPQQGNAMFYVSKETLNAYVDLRDRLTMADPTISSIMPMYNWMMPILTIGKQQRASASITVVDATSIYNEDRWPVSSGGMGSMSSVTTIGLLSAMAIPAFQKVRVQSREKAITNNLRMVASAGQQYILEEGAVKVTYKQLEGEYFAPLESVAGEDYTGLVVSEEGGELEVTTKDGNTITYTY